jgi:photosynthetic reaction center H subunit
MFNEFTGYIDGAQIALYLFWFFFAGLVWWIRREDRREGYPLETDLPRKVWGTNSFIFFPPEKTVTRPDGSDFTTPDYNRDEREMQARRSMKNEGYPYLPEGEALTSKMGPASYPEGRGDKPELTREGHEAIVPMRIAEGYSVFAGPDPRGWDVIGADGEKAGTCTDIWVDRAEMLVRYLEMTVDSLEEGDAVRLVPINMLVLQRFAGVVDVEALKAADFVKIPAIAGAEQITLNEEDKVRAFFAGARLYGDPRSAEPLI